MYVLKSPIEIAIFWHALDMALHMPPEENTLSESEKVEVKTAQDALTKAIYKRWKVWMPSLSAYLQKENGYT